MDSTGRRIFVSIIVLALQAGLAQSLAGQDSPLLKQSQRLPGQVTAAGVVPDKSVFDNPSPLSRFVSDAPTPFYFSTTIPANQVVTHRIDLRDVIRGYAEQKKCSMGEAFSAAAATLNMTPIGAEQLQTGFGDKAFYQVQAADTYLITATQKYFNALESRLHQLQYGNIQIVLEVRFLQVPTGIDMQEVYKHAIPGSFRAHKNSLPQIEPVATHTSSSKKGGNDVAAGTFASSTATRSKAYPTFMAKLNDIGVHELTNKVKANAEVHLVQAPTVTLFPNQSTTVSDQVQRPFVVDVKTLKGDFSVAHQPVIQILEEGTKMVLKAGLKDGKIQLAGDLAFCEIMGVETLKYPNANIEIQIPEHRVRTVHWSHVVEDGGTVLIDPVESKTIEIRKTGRFKKSVSRKTVRQIVLVTPRIIVAE